MFALRSVLKSLPAIQSPGRGAPGRTCKANGFARRIGASLFIFTLAVPALAAEPPLPNYFTRIWRTEEGLPHNAVNAIVQTRDGYYAK